MYATVFLLVFASLVVIYGFAMLRTGNGARIRDANDGALSIRDKAPCDRRAVTSLQARRRAPENLPFRRRTDRQSQKSRLRTS